VLRVGDRIGIFDPDLTYRIGLLMEAAASANPGFRWQRKLMPGGVCEATAFGAYGYRSSCLCLPLGHYHNMRDPDTKRPVDRAAPEQIHLNDFHGLIEALVFLAQHLDDRKTPSLRDEMDHRYATKRHLLGKIFRKELIRGEE
ncbi:MAG: hypothetical protein U1E27_13415, partial [Kiritimatiellia bacterium]|nr:hypothetical protein [Kiritimatiellia bacterium]